MAKTFFFYDLETSGLNARDDRIMQFAGQRTDMDLQPIGDPINILVALSDDILPSPDAIMVTGITPQSTKGEGYSEPEFCKYLVDNVFTPDTVTVGFNNIRFDDEFIRHTFWRNFYDPYEWAWSEGRGRWDMLDVVRMTRALRPDGMEWPVDEKGKAVNKLERIASANNLTHTKAHDALSDVVALIDLARLIKTKQPKQFDYLQMMRDKKKIAELVDLRNPQPFVYTSGRYDPALEKTTVAYPLAQSTNPSAVIVYDLRQDPSAFLNATAKQLSEILSANWETRQQEGFRSLPVKELAYTKCPAVAPMGVLDEPTKERLAIDLDIIKHNLSVLTSNPGFADVVHEAYQMREPYKKDNDVEHALYDGFINDKDKPKINAVRNADATALADFQPTFVDERLDELLFRYKSRNFPISLTDDEQVRWEEYRAQKLRTRFEPYMESLERLRRNGADQYLLEELHLWAESIMLVDV